MFVIQPAHPWWQSENWTNGQAAAGGFRYASDTNGSGSPRKNSTHWSTVRAPDSCRWFRETRDAPTPEER